MAKTYRQKKQAIYQRDTLNLLPQSHAQVRGVKWSNANSTNPNTVSVTLSGNDHQYCLEHDA